MGDAAYHPGDRKTLEIVVRSGDVVFAVGLGDGGKSADGAEVKSLAIKIAEVGIASLAEASPSVAREVDHLADHYRPPSAYLLLGWLGDQPAAVCGVARLDSRTAELKRLYVRPAARGHRLGWSLTGPVAELAREMGPGRRLPGRTPAPSLGRTTPAASAGSRGLAADAIRHSRQTGIHPPIVDAVESAAVALAERAEPGDLERAAVLLGAAAAERTRLELSDGPGPYWTMDRARTRIREGIGAEAAAALIGDRQLDLDDAADQVLDLVP